MNTLLINSDKEFDNLTKFIDSLSEDYQEFLAYFLEMQEEPYSLDYVYARLFILKGYFDRALAGLNQTSFRYPVAQKLNGQLQYNQPWLEEQFSLIEKHFWKNLPMLLEFRNEIKEYRNRFLIFDAQKYPWWYPEKRKQKTKPTLQPEKA
jgi:hypothetical protein